MKKYLLLLSVTAFWTVQANALDLDNDKKRFSYFVGMQIGQQLMSDNIELDEESFLAAIKDMAAGKPPRMSQEEIEATLQRIQEQKMAEATAQGERNRQEGEQFLASNKQKAGVVTTDSGLQYKVIKAGTGAMPKATDTVVVQYRGTLINGTEFDSSYSRGEPATFPVNGVIEGWQEVLQLMKEGAKWQVYVPADLAYGSRGAGGLIGPNATLVFDVELLSIQK